MSRWKESLPATEEKILGVGTREGIVAVPAVMDDAAEVYLKDEQPRREIG